MNVLASVSLHLGHGSAGDILPMYWGFFVQSIGITRENDTLVPYRS